ncbi:MAG: hypothetical protein ACP5OP_01870 [Leptospirillia bacterium]
MPLFFRPFRRLLPLFSSLLTLVALSSLGGCKGGVLAFPGSANESLSGPSLYSVSGVAMDGPISGGSVAVAQYQSDGSLVPLGTVTTGRDGRFQITSLFDLSGGPVSFTLTGGTNIDIASGATITTPTGVSLTALIPASDLTHTMVVLTPFSSLEATEAQTLATQGRTLEQAVTKAQTDWSGFLGFDPAEVPPSNMASGPASANASGIYGLLLAGLSQFTNHISQTQNLAPGTANPLGLLPLLEEDLGDGVFNGLAPGNPTPLTYYGYTLSGESLRQELTAEALIFLWSGQNQSGLTPQTTDGILNGVAMNTGPLFPSSPSPVLPDPGTPQVTISNPTSATFVNKTISVIASATDSLGIATLVITGSGIVLPGGELTGNPVLAEIDTTKSPSGPASLSATATDYAGNTQTTTTLFTIDNVPPTITNLNPANGGLDSPGCTGSPTPVTVSGILQDNLSGPSSVSVQETSPTNTGISVSYTSVNSTTGQFSFTFTAPPNNCKTATYAFTINGFDKVDNETVLNYTLEVTN